MNPANTMTHRLAAILMSLVGAAAGTAAAAAPVERGNLAGVPFVQTTIDFAGVGAELRALVPGRRPGDDMALLALRPDSAPMDAQRLSVVAAAAGEFRSHMLAGVAGTAAAGLAGSVHIASDAEGQGWLLEVSAAGTLQLHRLASDGSIERSLRVPADLPSPSVTVRTLTAHPQGLLLAGATGSRPLLMVIDSSGRVLQTTVLQQEGAAVSARPLADGQLLALVESASLGDPGFWVGAVAADGSTPGPQLRSSGRPLAMAVQPDGRSAVIYTVAGVQTQDIMVKGITPGRELAWTRTLVERQTAVTRFDIVPMPRGEFLVAGKKDRGLWLGRLSRDGAETWQAWRDPRARGDLEITLDVDVAEARDHLTVGYSALVVADRRQTSVVRTLQLRFER
jgi:hypothetical protein